MKAAFGDWVRVSADAGLYGGGVLVGESFIGDMDLARSVLLSCQ